MMVSRRAMVRGVLSVLLIVLVIGGVAYGLSACVSFVRRHLPENQGLGKSLREAELEVHRAEQKLGQDHPEVARQLDRVAALCFQLVRLRDAEAACQRALVIREAALAPDHPDRLASVSALATVYLFRGKKKEARELYRRYLGRDYPGDSADLAALAAAYQEKRRPRLILFGIPETTSSAPGGKGKSSDPRAAMLSQAVGELLRTGRLREAAVFLRQSPDDLPDSTTAPATLWERLGNFLVSERQFELAAEKFEEALRLAPDSSAAHRGLALCVTQQGDLQRAIGHFDAALRGDPGSIELRYWVGTTCLVVADELQGRLERWGDWEDLIYAAAQRLSEVVATRPDYPNAYFELASASLALGRILPAIEELQAQLKVDPQHASARELHAWLSWQLSVWMAQVLKQTLARQSVIAESAPSPPVLMIPEPRMLQEKWFGFGGGTVTASRASSAPSLSERGTRTVSRSQ